MTFDLEPSDLNINRDHLLTKDYLPTNIEASGAKRSWVISCTRWSRLAWPLTLTFDLLTWIWIGVIYSPRTIYLLSLKLLGQNVLELSVAQGEVNWHDFDLDLWPTELKINRSHLLIKDYLPTKFEASGAQRSCVISCTRWSKLAWHLTLNLLTWISIGIIYSPRTIYQPSLKLLWQSVLEFSVAQGEVDWHDLDLDLWPTDLKINRDHLLTKDYLPTKFEASGAKRSWVISCTRLRDTDIPTYRPTDRPTYRPTGAKQYALLFQRGGINIALSFSETHIEGMYCIETGREWKMRTPKFSWIEISFDWGLLENFEKWTENESYQFSKFTVSFKHFSLQKHKIYRKLSKVCYLYCTSSIIYTKER